MTARIFVASTILLVSSSLVFAEGSPIGEAQVSKPQRPKANEQLVQTESVNVAMWCQAADGGHRINITASNSDGAVHNCSSVCYTRDNKGRSGVVSASGSVPAHANRVLFASSYDSTVTRTVINTGSFSCQ
ncbi:hypothetical protein [Ralstonia pseudosolanacearum]